ncbi:histidine kinase [Alteromonas sp. SM 2104]|nr:histidine kinase [Alteromonas oceanisediminis]
MDQLVYVWPWYISWFWFTPLLVIVVKMFITERTTGFAFMAKHLALFCVFFPCYFLSFGLSVFLANGELVESTNFAEGLTRYFSQNYWAEDFTIYVCIMLGAYVSAYLQQIRIKEKENLMLQTQLYKVQLDALKSQLNPHFLFNALNTISGLMRMKSSDTATSAIAELSYMLRSILERQEDVVSVREEVQFIEKYIFFQTLRFEKRLVTEIKISEDAKNMKIPFLLLHTLVENAIKHGAQEEGNVNTIHLSATLLDKRLHIQLANTMATEQKHEGFGIGLLNCKKRLELLYHDDFELRSNQCANNQYLTVINLPAEQMHV